MSISAKVIEDSIADNGKRITTMQLLYPRFVHAEFMTHRVFSRNASSSRAIPVAKMIEQVRSNPAMPIHWGKNQPGMQASEQLTGDDLEYAKRLWLRAAQDAAMWAEFMTRDIGAHKQVVNRILEPFLHISVIVTATEWGNFFELRDHPDAQPEIRELAIQMKRAIDGFGLTLRPRNHLHESGWHLPYVTFEERYAFQNDPAFLAKLSAARCARVSYLTHEGKIPSIEEDLKLYERLVGGRPLHSSPVEHQAYPLPLAMQRSNNFSGWRQNRELVDDAFRV